MENTPSGKAQCTSVDDLMSAAIRCLAGSATLVALYVANAIRTGVPTDHGMVLVLVCLPVLLSLAEAGLLVWLTRLRFTRCFYALLSVWTFAPLLLVSMLPCPPNLKLGPIAIAFIPIAIHLILPVKRLYNDALSRHTLDRLLITGFLRAFAMAMFFLFQKCLYHDALWNYGYLRSIIIDHDFDMYNEFFLRNSYLMYTPHPAEPIFFMGSALFMAPFFLLAHALTVLFGPVLNVLQDGYTWPYTLLTSFSGIFASLTATILIYRLLRQFFAPLVSAATIGLVFFAGNLVFYTFVWPLYTHPFSVMMISAFLLLWVRTANGRTHSHWLLFGLILGISVWIRPQNAIFGIIPAWELVSNAVKARKILKQQMGAALLLGLGVAIGFAPQMIVWLRTEGTPLIDAYGQIGDDFSWFRPRLIYLLFSTRQGFFSWHPLFLACVPGFVLFWRKRRDLAGPLGICFLIQLYIISCYEFPEGGAGFGSRYLLATTPFLAICLAEAISSIIAQRATRAAASAAALILVFANLLLLVAYHMELLPHNQPMPSLTVMLKQVFVVCPGRLSFFVTSLHINENVFARPFFWSLAHAHYSGLLFASAGFAFSVLPMALFAYMVDTGTLRRSQMLALTGTIGAAMLLVCALLFLPGSRYINDSVYPVLMSAYHRQEAPPAITERDVVLDALHPEINIPISYLHPFTGVDFVYTYFPANIETTSPVIRISMTQEDGRELHFSLHASDSTDAAPPLPVRHWLSSSGGSYCYTHGYLASFWISPAAPIRDLTLELANSNITTVVSGIYLKQASSEGSSRRPLVQVLFNE